jgi:hypothetical protein
VREGAIFGRAVGSEEGGQWRDEFELSGDVIEKSDGFADGKSYGCRDPTSSWLGAFEATETPGRVVRAAVPASIATTADACAVA